MRREKSTSVCNIFTLATKCHQILYIKANLFSKQLILLSKWVISQVMSIPTAFKPLEQTNPTPFVQKISITNRSMNPLNVVSCKFCLILALGHEKNPFNQFIVTNLHYYQSFWMYRKANDKHSSFKQSLKLHMLNAFKFKVSLLLCSFRFFIMASANYFCGEKFISWYILSSPAANFFR